MSASSGKTYLLLWGECDRVGWSLKTRRGLLPGFPPSSVDLPNSGTWDLTGYYRQAPLGPAISESASSSSPLLPTPVAQDSSTSAEAYLERKSRDGSQRTAVTSLAVVVRDCLLPTPTAGDGQGGGVRPTTAKQLTQPTGTGAGRSRLRDVALALIPTPVAADGQGSRIAHSEHPSGTKVSVPSQMVAMALLPTPTAHDAHGAKTPEQVQRQRERGGGVSNLNEVVLTLLPTPTAADAKSNAGQRDKPNRPKAGTTLTEAARGMALLPTPMARDGDGRTGGDNNTRRRMARGHGPMLPELMDYPLSPDCQTAPPGTTGLPSGDMRLF